MPVQADVYSKVDAFGVEGSARIVTSFKNYQLVKNPKYATIKPQVLDDKIFKAEAKELNRKKLDKKTILEQKEITLKQLKKLSKDLEKEEVKEKKEKKEEIIASNYSHTEDTLARKRTEDFWEAERQVPLTEIEVKGYQKTDSIYAVNARKINIKLKKDSTERLRPAKFKFEHLISGNSYPYNLVDKNTGDIFMRNMSMFTGKIVEETTLGAPVNQKQLYNFTKQLASGVKEYKLNELLALKGISIDEIYDDISKVTTQSQLNDLIYKIIKAIC